MCENDKVHSKHAVNVSCQYYKELKGSINYPGLQSSNYHVSDTKFQKLDFKKKRKNIKIRGRRARDLNI